MYTQNYIYLHIHMCVYKSYSCNNYSKASDRLPISHVEELYKYNVHNK